MWFFGAALVFMTFGRKLGWGVSKSILYRAPGAVAIFGCVLWGCAVGLGMSALIGWLQPGTALKWIMGFALGAYVAIPNFGLNRYDAVPDSALPRHIMVSNLPLITYAVVEFATRSMRIGRPV
jgi:hypothetical protein